MYDKSTCVYSHAEIGVGSEKFGQFGAKFAGFGVENPALTAELAVSDAKSSGNLALNLLCLGWKIRAIACHFFVYAVENPSDGKLNLLCLMRKVQANRS